MTKEELMELLQDWRATHAQALEADEVEMLDKVINSVGRRPQAAVDLDELISKAKDEGLLSETGEQDAEQLLESLKA